MGMYDKGSPTRESIEALFEKILDNREQFAKLFDPEDWMAFAHIIHLTNKAFENIGSNTDADNVAKEYVGKYLYAYATMMRSYTDGTIKLPLSFAQKLLDYLGWEAKIN